MCACTSHLQSLSTEEETWPSVLVFYGSPLRWVLLKATPCLTVCVTGCVSDCVYVRVCVHDLHKCLSLRQVLSFATG